MDKFENYGFRLETDITTTQEQYDNIKGVICDICFHIEEKIRGTTIEGLIIAFPLQKDSAHVSINVHNNQVRFAVFKDGKLHNSFPLCDFSLFDFDKASSIYTKRCENLVEMFMKGKLTQSQLAKENIVIAWKQRLLKEKIATLTPESEGVGKYTQAFYRQITGLKGDVDKIAKNTGFSKEQISAIKNYIFSGNPDFLVAHSWQRLMGNREQIAPHDIIMLKNKLYELDFLSRGYSPVEAKNNADAVHNYTRESRLYYAETKNDIKDSAIKHEAEYENNDYQR